MVLHWHFPRSKSARLRAAIWLGAVALAAGGVRADLHEDFTTNPLPGSATVRTTLADAMDGTRFAYVTDAYGPGVQAAYDSNQPTTKLLFSLGQTLTQNNSFTVSTKFVLGNNLTSVPDNGMQISFGLVNSVTTGADRAGGTNHGTGGNAYDEVTVDYYPGQGTYGGPFLSPTMVQSASTVAGNSDGYFAAIDFTPKDRLNANLPTGVLLNAVMKYDAPTELLTLQVYQDNTALDINSPLNNTPDSTTIANDLSLAYLQYYGVPFSTFSVDSFGINLFADTWNPTGNSIEGDVVFHQIDVTDAPALPEPSALGLLGIGAMALWLRRTRR